MSDEPGTQPKRPVTRVTGFDSHEDFLRWQEENEREANAGVLPKQREITWGSYFFRLAEAHGPEPIQIFAYVYTPEEVIQLEMSAGASLTEASDYARLKESTMERGYLWGMHYSDVEPDGELGSTHRVNAWPITERDFNRAKALGWHLSPEAMSRVMSEMEEAVSSAGERLD